MTNVFSILYILWSIRIIGNVVSFAQLWWVKEYRWDRMVIHLGTRQGRFVYFLPWKRPRISPKSVLLIVLTLFMLFAFVLLSGFPPPAAFLLADLLSFPLTFLVVGILYVPTFFYHRSVISKARKMLRAQHLTVIGITGSYGKTSTKEYLAAILSVRYRTLKTEASKNAPIGISEVVVSRLQNAHEMFVVEMGAYKKGEIAFMADLVRPEIAVVTAINAQHQDLFGSIENTMHAKYELVAGLSGKRIAVMNADDKRVREMGDWAKKDGVIVWWYTAGEASEENEPVFRASEIQSGQGGVSFVCSFGKQKERIHAPVVGMHQAGNITAAIAAAVAAGMPFTEAARAASHITPVEHMLVMKKGIGGIRIIDDTFNNNPDAAKAALDVLAKEHGKKFLVFQPMIELGKYAEESHEDVGAYAGKMCDEVILTNRNYYDAFLRGVRKSSQKIPVAVLGPNAAATYLREKTRPGDTVLCKSKEAALVVRRLEI